MALRMRISPWTRLFNRSFKKIARDATRAGSRAVAKAVKTQVDKRRAPPGTGHWIAGVAMSAAGARRYRLYRPNDVAIGERLPLMVMLHGCGQDAGGFATSTRMNRIAARERFLVLYPEQDRLANAHGCWNWFDTDSGRAHGESGLIMKAIDQVCLLYPVDRTRVAVAGMSAGASMAALLVSRHPERFKAVVMHSGVPPGTAHSGLSALGAMKGRRATLSLGGVPASPTATWPPLLVIHGTADGVVSARNGRAAAQTWADAGGAREGPSRGVRRGQRHAMTITDFRRGRAMVASLVEVDGLGHAWSGGASRQPYGDPHGPDASRMVWAFAKGHFKI